MLMSAADGAPERFAGVSREEWTAVLEDAARVGLLAGIGAGMYQIHPALPGYLAAGWQADRPDRYEQERDAGEQALCAAAAYYSRWTIEQIGSGNAALAYAVISWHRRTLGAMLGRALDHQAWEDANGIVRALDAYWDIRGLGGEAAAWADRILAATVSRARGSAAAARSLWMYIAIRQATRQKDAGRPDQAAQVYRQVLAWLQDEPETEWIRGSVAVIYHQLGMTAQDRGRLDEAEDWYRKSLTIDEELGNRPGMAITYHELGITAQDRGRLDEADDWYRKSLTIERGTRRPPRHGHHLPPARHDRPGPRAAGRGRGLVPQIPHHQRGTRQPPRHGASPTTSSA